MSTSLEIIEVAKLEAKDVNRFSHYAEKVSVTEGYVLGTPVLAVCGKLFIPSRDPKKFPLCPICKKISEALFFSEE
jgi:hypothetical protein